MTPRWDAQHRASASLLARKVDRAGNEASPPHYVSFAERAGHGTDRPWRVASQLKIGKRKSCINLIFNYRNGMYISIIRSNAYSAILVRSKNKMYSADEPCGAPPRRISRVKLTARETKLHLNCIHLLFAEGAGHGTDRPSNEWRRNWKSVSESLALILYLTIVTACIYR